MQTVTSAWRQLHTGARRSLRQRRPLIQSSKVKEVKERRDAFKGKQRDRHGNPYRQSADNISQ
jgi:hypothetical protein